MSNTLTGYLQAEKMTWSSIPSDLVLATQQALLHGDTENNRTVLKFIIQCEKKITPFILSKMRSRRIARETCLHEDVTREVILILLKSSLLTYRVESSASFETYLFKIAERTFSRMLSRAEPVSRLLTDHIDPETLITYLTPPSPTENDENQRLTRVQLQAALSKLSPTERDAVLSYALEGNTFQEIADSRNIPLSSAYRYIKNIFNKLRQELTENDQSSSPRKEK